MSPMTAADDGSRELGGLARVWRRQLDDCLQDNAGLNAHRWLARIRIKVLRFLLARYPRAELGPKHQNGHSMVDERPAVRGPGPRGGAELRRLLLGHENADARLFDLGAPIVSWSLRRWCRTG